MKFCQAHWDRLRQEIDNVGLLGFVAKDGATATQMVKDELEGVNDPTAPPDPLMNAHWQIATEALKCGGLYLLTGDYCPLCEMESNSDIKADEWIVPCCATLKAWFVEQGWAKETPIQ